MFSLQNVKKTIGFTVFSLQNVKKPLVLLCFRSKMLQNHWFYCVFLTFSFKNVKKPLVLLCFPDFSGKKVKKPLVLLWKILKKSKNHYKTCVFLKKRVVKPISSNGFGPCVSHTRLDKLWGTLTDKLFREKYQKNKSQRVTRMVGL